jgi:hypothetical protein
MAHEEIHTLDEVLHQRKVLRQAEREHTMTLTEVAAREAFLEDTERALRVQYEQRIDELIDGWNPHSLMKIHQQQIQPYITQRGRLRSKVHNNRVRLESLNGKLDKVRGQLARGLSEFWLAERDRLRGLIEETTADQARQQAELDKIEIHLAQEAEIRERLAERAAVLKKGTLRPSQGRRAR